MHSKPTNGSTQWSIRTLAAETGISSTSVHRYINLFGLQPHRSMMLGRTQLNWLQQGLLDAQARHISWKVIAISSPIDQIGAIGSGADGGKSWMGGYRVERNRLLKFIADNQIDNVVFLSTDDHQIRINELGYFTQFDANNTPIQSSYVRAPKVFEIVAGPIGATGPGAITEHSFAHIQSLTRTLVNHQIAAGSTRSASIRNTRACTT